VIGAAGRRRHAARRSALQAVHSQRGQALIETLASSLLLVPLWLAVLYVSRWHDLQFATIEAARYGAFAAHQSAGEEAGAAIGAQAVARLFTRDAARFGDVGANGPVANLPPDLPQWRHADGSHPLIAENYPRVEVGAVAEPAPVERLEAVAFDLIAPALAVGRGPLELQRGAARRSSAELVVAPLGAATVPPAALALHLREHLSLMVDGWAARDPAAVILRANSLSAAGALAAVMEPVAPLRWAVSTLEPAFDDLCLGRTDPEIVPPDRLFGARLGAIDLRQVPCR
jgi:hypothetical protein